MAVLHCRQRPYDSVHAAGKGSHAGFQSNHVGFVPPVVGHYIENIGNTDLIFVEMFKANQFLDFSLNDWFRRLLPGIVSSHLSLDATEIRKIPVEKQEAIAA
jgi:oxalate decarboxylase